MSIEETKVTAEVGSSRELNNYLRTGWELILAYVKNSGDNQLPRFVVGWKAETDPIYPEFLDEWELSEIQKNKNR
jgi:hypothetical protein